MGRLTRIANLRLNQLEILARRTRFVSRPVTLLVELTNRCNSWCLMCAHPEYRRSSTLEFGEMSADVFEETRPFWPFVKNVCLGGNGEPFMHSEHLAMAEKLKGAGVYVHTFTNGTLLERPIAERLVETAYDRVHVSLDGAQRATYLRLRGIDAFDQVIEHLGLLRDLKAEVSATRPEVRFNITGTRSSLRELGESVRLAAALGVTGIDVHHMDVYSPALREESPWLDPQESVAWISAAADIAAQLGVELKGPSFEETRGSCLQPMQSLDVRWDGLVFTCSGYRFVVGDLRRETIAAVWNGPAMQGVRRRIWRDGYPQVCPGCSAWDSRAETYLDTSPAGRRGTSDARLEGDCG